MTRSTKMTKRRKQIDDIEPSMLTILLVVVVMFLLVPGALVYTTKQKFTDTNQKNSSGYNQQYNYMTQMPTMQSMLL